MGKLSERNKERRAWKAGEKYVPPSHVGDPEEIDRIMNEEFNPVKEETKLPPATVMLVDPTGEYIGNIEYTPDGGMKFNGYKLEPKQSEIKTTAAFDNARLEYMRMQISPVQNFYTTLGNILLSFDERIRRLEEEYASKKLQEISS